MHEIVKYFILTEIRSEMVKNYTTTVPYSVDELVPRLVPRLALLASSAESSTSTTYGRNRLLDLVHVLVPLGS